MVAPVYEALRLNFNHQQRQRHLHKIKICTQSYSIQPCNIALWTGAAICPNNNTARPPKHKPNITNHQKQNKVFRFPTSTSSVTSVCSKSFWYKCICKHVCLKTIKCKFHSSNALDFSNTIGKRKKNKNK